MSKNQKHLYAGEVAKVIGNGLTASMVGKIANKLNLKTNTYGIWVQDAYCTPTGCIFHKSVFKYSEDAIRMIRIYLQSRGK